MNVGFIENAAHHGLPRNDLPLAQAKEGRSIGDARPFGKANRSTAVQPA
jgi:hypothetical protein